MQIIKEIGAMIRVSKENTTANEFLIDSKTDPYICLINCLNMREREREL